MQMNEVRKGYQKLKFVSCRSTYQTLILVSDILAINYHCGIISSSCNQSQLKGQ